MTMYPGPLSAQSLLALERKDAEGGSKPGQTEIKGVLDQLCKSFDEFKQANDERLSNLEKGREDAVTNEKVDRINADITKHQKALDDIKAALARPAHEATSERKDGLTADQLTHKQAFNAFVRRGDLQFDGKALTEIEQKALSVGSNPDGGYLTTVETEQMVDRIVTDISPIRSIATVRQISASAFKKPVTTSGAAGGWVSEKASRPQTDAPGLSELEFPTFELYAEPAATQTLLDDARVDMEAYLGDEIGITFAQLEGAAYVNGNGSSQPKGFLSYTPVADASWVWGKIGFVTTGANGNFKTSDTPRAEADSLIDLVYAPKQAYRSGAQFVMNRKTEGRVRKIKDADGNYLWQPSMQAGAPGLLMGYPITNAEDMPDYTTTGAHAIAFGNFRRGYLIIDRVGIRLLRDPFSAKPYVLFYATKRVGGGVQHFEAIKTLKFSS